MRKKYWALLTIGIFVVIVIGVFATLYQRDIPQYSVFQVSSAIRGYLPNLPSRTEANPYWQYQISYKSDGIWEIQLITHCQLAGCSEKSCAIKYYFNERTNSLQDKL
jgi:hypothetical protein